MNSGILQISIREANCTIQWIVIYPVDSAIQAEKPGPAVYFHPYLGGVFLHSTCFVFC